MALSLQSPSFQHGEEIPKRHSGESSDLSPALLWSWVPEGTRSFVLICEDPDAPRPEPFVHWLIYNIPGSVTQLPEGIPPKGRVDIPPGATQGENSWGNLGYGGPMPPPGHGWHRYVFRLFALDTVLALDEGATKEEVLEAIKGHALEDAVLVGKYQRERQTDFQRAG